MTILAALLSDISTGEPAMDKRYSALFASLQQLSECNEGEFCSKYAAAVGQVEEIFREEEIWMDAIEYPNAGLHQEQHARVLSALHHVHGSVMDGQTELGRDVVSRLLPQWLAFHIETMDTSLAISMQATDTHYAPLMAGNRRRPVSIH